MSKWKCERVCLEPGFACMKSLRNCQWAIRGVITAIDDVHPVARFGLMLPIVAIYPPRSACACLHWPRSCGRSPRSPLALVCCPDRLFATVCLSCRGGPWVGSSDHGTAAVGGAVSGRLYFPPLLPCPSSSPSRLISFLRGRLSSAGRWRSIRRTAGLLDSTA